MSEEAVRVRVRPLESRDRPAWRVLFGAYIEFYAATVPEDVIDTLWGRLMHGGEGFHLGLVAVGGDDTPIGLAPLVPPFDLDQRLVLLPGGPVRRSSAARQGRRAGAHRGCLRRGGRPRLQPDLLGDGGEERRRPRPLREGRDQGAVRAVSAVVPVAGRRSRGSTSSPRGWSKRPPHAALVLSLSKDEPRIPAVVRPSEQIRGHASSPRGWSKRPPARLPRPELVEGRAMHTSRGSTSSPRGWSVPARRPGPEPVEGWAAHTSPDSTASPRGSIVPQAPAFAEMWIPGTSPGMTIRLAEAALSRKGKP